MRGNPREKSMRNSISEVMDSFRLNKHLKPIYQFSRKLYHYYYKNLCFWGMAAKRYLGFADDKCTTIRSFKNIHEGRCFIIATGPSLTMVDLKKLEKEWTFGVNSICKVTKELGWEPTYFGIQDQNVFESLKLDLDQLKKTTGFIGSTVNMEQTLPFNWCEYPLNLLNHQYTYDVFTSKFSKNSFLAVYDGYSVVYSMLQIAVYMGFKEIYLIGCDCTYSDDRNKQHFVETGVFDPTYKTAGERMIFAYKKAKQYADKNGINIYNATRGGMLEVFPRVDLDDVLDLKERIL